MELKVSALALERLRGVFDADVVERLRGEIEEVHAALLVFVAGGFLSGGFLYVVTSVSAAS